MGKKLTSRLVQESLALDGYEVIPQKTKKTWFGDNGDVRGIRQDILVKSGNNVIAVLDSKCKEQLSSSDLAEISLYIHENRLKSGIAIMPTCPGKPEIKWTSSDGKISIYEKRLDIAQIVNNLRKLELLAQYF